MPETMKTGSSFIFFIRPWNIYLAQDQPETVVYGFKTYMGGIILPGEQPCIRLPDNTHDNAVLLQEHGKGFMHWDNPLFIILGDFKYKYAIGSIEVPFP